MRAPGDWIHGKYQVESVLGSGGMGVVYATRRRNESRAAVKVLHERFARDKSIRARFIEEGHLANRVGHRAVVTILEDDIDEQGNLYLVMELLEGVDLGAFIVSPRKPIAVSQALCIAEQLLGALSQAHQKGIIHQDIKPANVMILRDGRVKLLDFGVAKTLFPDGAFCDEEDEDELILGTDRFMSPEQGQGMLDAVDCRTDIWAMGALLLELLSDQDASEVPLWDQSYEDRAWSFSRLGSDVPPRVTQIISKALQPQKAHRWVSAQEMRHAIREVHEQLFGPVSLDGLAPLGGGETAERLADDLSELRPEIAPAEPTILSRPSHGPPATERSTPVPSPASAPTEPQDAHLLRSSAPPRRRAGGRGWRIAALLTSAILAGLVLWTWADRLPSNSDAPVESELPPQDAHREVPDDSGATRFVATTDAAPAASPLTEIPEQPAVSEQKLPHQPNRQEKLGASPAAAHVRDEPRDNAASGALDARDGPGNLPEEPQPGEAQPFPVPSPRCVNESGQVDLFDARVCPP